MSRVPPGRLAAEPCRLHLSEQAPLPLQTHARPRCITQAVEQRYLPLGAATHAHMPHDLHDVARFAAQPLSGAAGTGGLAPRPAQLPLQTCRLPCILAGIGPH